MLLALAVVVSWITLEAWRPDRTLPPRKLADGTTPRLRELLAACDVERPATYRWLQHPATAAHQVPAPVAAELPSPPPLPLEDPPPSLYAYHAVASPNTTALLPDDCWTPSTASLAAAPRDALLTVAHPSGLRLASQLNDVDWTHPAWQLVAPPDWQHGPLVGYSVWHRYFATRQAPVTPRRYASPPSLLGTPLLTDASQRLAMIPQRDTGSVDEIDARTWRGRLLEAARPLLVAGVDHALGDTPLAEPISLVAMLKRLSLEPECHDWAIETLATLDTLLEPTLNARATDTATLEHLAYLSLEAERLAAEVHHPGLATRLRRARYAIWRRVEVWHAVAAIMTPPVEHVALASGETTASGRGDRKIAASQPVAMDELLSSIERYEQDPSLRNNRAVAWRLAQLADSPHATRRELANTLEAHYRNANARLAITADMVNRFLPSARTHVEPIHDRVLGTPVTGQARTQSAATVTLLPDDDAWRLGLEIAGHANSQVVAFERTVRVRTSGTTRFAARQQVVIDGTGMRTGPVVADANSSSQFVSARSEFDRVPLLGGVIRSKAASAFATRRYRAQDEVAAKTEVRVKEEMNRAVREAGSRALGQWQSRIVAPLALGGVRIEPVEMSTTEQRLVARARIERELALTSVTPRPRAPSDSLASLQLHESALTNLISSLDLAGRRLTGAQFAERLRRFAPNRPAPALDEDAREAEIEFAATDPVAFELAEGQLHVVYNVDELKVRGRSDSDFKVHVYYAPRPDGLVVRFDHKRGPYLEGNMRNSQRMRLQTIFGKVFPPGGQLAMGEQYAGDERLSGVMITQLLIDDGWLAVALGPAAAERSAQLDRYAPVWR